MNLDVLSIIICTYVPEEEVFSRCLKAVAALDHPEGIKVEATIVDNNSPVPVSSLQYVKDLVCQKSWIKIIKEEKPGLTNARICGYKNSQAKWLIFFDDDNEPQSNYLTGLVSLLLEYPQVGIWGPGIIEVIYLHPATNWFLQHKQRFQQKKTDTEAYSFEKGWQKCYPPGTGQIINRSVLDAYTAKVHAGVLTAKDRTLGNLDSAGDVQIVYTAISMQQAVGISPRLQVNHLISGRKTTMRYAKRHSFGTNASYANAHLEFYPEDSALFVPHGQSFILKKLMPKFIQLLANINTRNNVLIEIAEYAGNTTGNYRAANKKTPAILKLVTWIFDLN